MTKFLTLSRQISLVFIGIILLSTMEFSRAARSNNLRMQEMSDDNDNTGAQVQRRPYDLNNLRSFLLTPNGEQRTTKREEQEFYKRELVNKFDCLYKKQSFELSFLLYLDPRISPIIFRSKSRST